MFVYSLKRLFQTVPVLFGVVTLVFFIIHLIPGDPVEFMLGENAVPASKELMRRQLGLDLPIMEQYFQYLRKLSRFDLGESIFEKIPVLDLIIERLPSTMQLGLFSMLVSLFISIPLGILAAIHKGKPLDYLSTGISLLGISMPSFWIGPLLVLFFSVRLGWFPVSEKSGFSSFVLPSITLGTALAAMTARMTRTSMLEVLKSDYIVTARAKGSPEFWVICKHALKNALIPVITVIGLQTGALLSGAIITETIFDWPGIGLLIYEAIQNRNYPLIQGCVIVITLCFVFVNFLTDISYKLANPRIRLQ